MHVVVAMQPKNCSCSSKQEPRKRWKSSSSPDYNS